MRSPRTSSRTAAAVLLLLVAVLANGCARARVSLPTVTVPRHPEYIYPAVPADLHRADLTSRQETGWAWLQAGDLGRAEREFLAALQQSTSFFPAEAALGYVEVARNNHEAALSRFDEALMRSQTYVPALVGRGEVLLALGRDTDALSSFEQALRVDSSLIDVGRRVEVLRFRAAEDNLGAAREAADAGRLSEAAQAYERAIAASPDSAFLYRDLADLEAKQGQTDNALEHYRKAAQLDASDIDARIRLGEVLEARGDLEGAVASYSEAVGIEPRPELRARIEALHARAALAKLPAEYRAIPDSPGVTRGELAALIGVRLEALLRSIPAQPPVITDVRDHWAAGWIMEVAGAGVMDPYLNHTFQPLDAVRRTDLAQAVGRLLQVIAARRPDLRRQWQAPQQFVDVGPGNLNYPDASLAVAAGVLPLLEGGTFQLSRQVSGTEAIDAVGQLERLFNTGR